MARPRLQRARRLEADRAPSRRAGRPLRQRRGAEAIDDAQFADLATPERADRGAHGRHARATGTIGKQASEHADLEVGGH